FWPDIDFSQYADGTIKGIISVDISEWDSPGTTGKTAKQCTREEVKTEVWEQLKRSLNIGGQEILKDEYLDHWFLDPAIYLVEGENDTNAEPLLVNLIDTWALRPDATTQIPNLFLASDYVRTYTDLATMEGANEAARRAVNGILAAAGSNASPCKLWKLHEPEIFEPWRMLDRIRYQQGLPWDDSLVQWGISALDLAHKGGGLLEQILKVTVDTPLEQLGNPLYAIGSQGFENTELRRNLMDIAQRWILDYLVRVAQQQGLPAMGGLPSIPHLGELPAMPAADPTAVTPFVNATQQRVRSGRVRIIP
ncbi:MAG: FAD-dependent oxidoreductase, partial [Thermosynechococcaceae cyanobacterium]